MTKESVVNYNVFDLGEFLTSVIRIIVIIMMIKVIIKAVAFKFQAYAADQLNSASHYPVSCLH